MSEPKQAAPADLSKVDLANPQTFQRYDLNELWRRLRDEQPVRWQKPRPGQRGFWALTRHEDVMNVYRDNVRFTSERGNVLTTLLQGHDSAAGQMLAVTDGNRHRDLRNVMLKSFSPKALADVAASVEARVRGLVAAAVEQESCDFAHDIAEKIPISTICDLLRVPESDREYLLGLNKQALSSDDADALHEDALVARNEILLYFGDLAEERRASPGDDVLSVLATCRVGGKPLSLPTIVANCYSLVIGGDETSRLSMNGSALALAEHPSQWARLRDGQVDIPTAVDELLRWTTPAMHFGRTARTPLTIRGHRIEAGEIVTLWNAAADRDERAFTDPETLNLDRQPNRHLAFGYGPHFCLGAHLGRVEMGAALRALRSLVHRIEVTGPTQWVHSNFLNGMSSLPVTLVADTSARP